MEHLKGLDRIYVGAWLSLFSVAVSGSKIGPILALLAEGMILLGLLRLGKLSNDYMTAARVTACNLVLVLLREVDSYLGLVASLVHEILVLCVLWLIVQTTMEVFGDPEGAVLGRASLLLQTACVLPVLVAAVFPGFSSSAVLLLRALTAFVFVRFVRWGLLRAGAGERI